ncbi:MAG: DUF4139 domain-containing protein [Bacteroidota bacterium]|nr:DUF4139 domain-containing protein [Bacteroidota bacterium]
MRCRPLLIEVFSVLLLFTFSSSMEGQTSSLDWTLNRVICHEVGAVLSFTTTLEAAETAQTLQLTGLPSDVDVADVQVALPDGLRLISAKRFAAAPNLNEAINRQEKQVEARKLALDLELALLAALNQEQAFLEANRTISGNDILLVDDVEEMRAYVAERHQALELDRVDLKSNVRGLKGLLAAEEAALATLLADAQTPSHTLELVISGRGGGDAEVSVATQQAGWVSSYDLAWNEKEGALEVGRHAHVIQTTGSDWEDVQLELRTGRPLGLVARGQQRPQLFTGNEASFGGYCANVQWVNSGLRDEKARALVLGGQGALASNWSMSPSGRVSISGTGAVARVWLDDQVMSAQTHWRAHPSNSEAAIRSCSTSDWMGVRMLSGEGRVFDGRVMMGVLPVNMPAWGDSLHIELGFDDLVRATSSLKREQSGTKKSSGKRLVEQVRNVRVYNDGQTDATVDVVEAIPTGEGWSMEVTATHGGVWDMENGQVQWTNVSVSSKASWEAEVVVRITLPKGGNVIGL